MLTSTPGIIASRKRNRSEYEALVSTSGGFPTVFPGKGSADCLDSVPVSTDLDVYDSNYKLGASYNTGVAQTFAIGKAYILGAVYVNIRRIGTLTGVINTRVYYSTGTYGTNATPGNLLGELTTTNASLIAAYEYGISADNEYETKKILMLNTTIMLLQPGVEYVLAIEYSGGDASNYLEISTRTLDLETNGNFSYKTTGSWTGINTVSLSMLLCAEEFPYDTTTTAYNFNNVTNYRTIGVGGVQKVGIAFTTANIQQLVTFTVFLKTVGTAANTTGTFTMELYAAASNQPTGSLLDTSNTNLAVNTIRSTYDQFTFGFTPYTLAASTTYTLVMVYNGGTVSTDISIGIGQDTTTSGYTGNSFYQNIGSGTWTNETSTIDHCFIMGIVNYTEAIFETYDATANGDQYNYIAATQNTKMAQSFTGIDGLFSKVTFTLKASGSPTGNITASLFADDGGTFGTTGKPTGTALATSGTIAASTINTGVDTPYTFTFASPYTMTAGTIYWVAIEYSSGSSTNKIAVVVDISSPTAPGRCAYYNGTTWAFTTYDNTGTSGATDDMCYDLYALT